MATNADFDRQTPNQGSGGSIGRPVPAAIQVPAPSLYHGASSNIAADRAPAHVSCDERTPLSPSRRTAAAPPPHAGSSGKHWWLDYLPLPYALVAPKMLCEKVAEDEQEQEEKDEQKRKQGGDRESKDGGGHNSSRRNRAAGANLTRRHSPTLSPAATARVAREAGSTSTAVRAASDPTHPLAVRQAKLNFLRHLFAEMLGTLILVFAHAMLRVKDLLMEISPGDDALYAGATLVLLIYSLGVVSGAHFNPVVTLAFSIRQMFPWEWIVPYWIAQLAGALLGGALLRGFYGEENAWRGTSFVSATSRLSERSALSFEIVITFILVFVILSVSQRGRIIGVHAALAVGATIALAVALGANVTGGCMNPVRALGPAIVNGPLNDGVWPCIVGPIIGGLLACAISWLLASEDASPGRGAAMGKGKAEPDDAEN